MKLEKEHIEKLGWKQQRIFENDNIIEHMYIIDDLGHDTLDNIQLQIIWLKMYPNRPDCVAIWYNMYNTSHKNEDDEYTELCKFDGIINDTEELKLLMDWTGINNQLKYK